MQLEQGLLMQQRAVTTHLITAHYAAPLLVARRQGLIVEITDGDHSRYRGSFYYDLVKMAVIRLAFNMAEDLRAFNVAAYAEHIQTH
jgi:NAD(P)-dependent dehydrogenase (short-subunit alcohol dehydrogenase family)